MNVRTFLAALLTLSLALVAGCSSDSGSGSSKDTGTCRGDRCGADVDEGDAAGGGDTGGATGCRRASDCPDGFTCDEENRVCARTCAQDGDCPGNQTCSDDLFCIPRPPCTTAAECGGAGQTCNTCDERCELLAPLCPPGQTCGFSECVEDQNCGFEEYCDACRGVCRPRLPVCAECTDDRECGEPEDLCLPFASGGRYCGKACGVAGRRCDIGYRCDDTLKQCVPLSSSCDRISDCTEDSACPRGQFCTANRLCAPGCVDDESCPGGQVCDQARCVAPCTETGSCPEGTECRPEGKCRAPGGCQTSRECGPEQYCDRAAGQCVAGCENDNDCFDGAKECINGACVKRGCRGAFNCNFGQLCNVATGDCYDAGPEYCSSCNGDDPDSCGTTNVCASLQDGNGTDQGAFCFVACSDDPDNICPRGYSCTKVEFQDDQGNVTEERRVCSRECYREPI